MTTIAAFSDLHVNTSALSALLSVINEVRPDVIVNLGDIASGGVDPSGTMDLLRTRPEVVTIRGNHERQLTTFPSGRLSESDRLAYESLLPADREWLGGLPRRIEIVPDVLAFHGAPHDDLCYLHDVDSAARLAERNGRDDVVCALRTGRV